MSIFSSRSFQIENGVLVKFKGNAAQVAIPSGVKTVGREAFRENKAIRSVTVPAGVTELAFCAFMRSGLVEITLPTTLRTIGSHAFGGCYSLKKVNIPYGVTTIRDYAFHYCSSLTELTVPDTVTTLMDNAFLSCDALKKVTLPERFRSRVAAIFGMSLAGRISFTYTGLGPITIGKPAAKAPPPPAPSAADFEINGTTLVKYNGAATRVTIPSAVKTVGKQAFAENKSVRSVVFHSGVTELDFGAFLRSGLTEITLLPNLRTIGTHAFGGCYSLKKVSIPLGVTTIRDYAFHYCSSLTELHIPESVTTLMDNAFLACNGLKTVTLPDRFRPRVAAIFGKPLADRISFTYTGAAPVTVGAPIAKAPPPPAPSSADFEINGTTLVKYKGNAAEVAIPSGIKTVRAYAFHENKAIRKLILPEGVEELGQSAFRSTGLTEITLPTTLRTIELLAFCGCISLTAVTLPEGLLTIGPSAFYGCALTHLTIPDSVTSLGGNAFLSCDTLKTVTLPERFRSHVATIFGKPLADRISFTYTGAPHVTVGAPIAKAPPPQAPATAEVEGQIGRLQDTLRAVLAKKDAATADMEIRDGVLLAYRGAATELSVPDGVREIAPDAFTGCRHLVRLTLPSGVKAIGDYAFFCCIALEALVLPEGVGVLGKDALTGCRSLKELTAPAALADAVKGMLGAAHFRKVKFTPLGEMPAGKPPAKAAEAPKKKEPPVIPPDFRVQSGRLEAYLGAGGEVVIPDGVVTVTADAFPSGCGVTSLFIPASVIEIEDTAFADLPRLSLIRVAEDNRYFCAHNGALYTKELDTLIQYPVANRNTSFVAPDGLVDIATGAFYGCRELHYVTLGASVTGIGAYAFYGCLHLSRVRMAAATVLLSEDAFAECPRLLEVTLPERSRKYLGNAFGEAAKSDIFRFY